MCARFGSDQTLRRVSGSVASCLRECGMRQKVVSMSPRNLVYYATRCVTSQLPQNNADK